MKQLFFFLAFILFSVGTKAQTDAKHDVILQLNGDELTGKVVQITDDAVKFMYAGETLEYSIKKSDILKITFGSGRIQVLNKPQLSSSSSRNDQAPAQGGGGGALGDHHNKVAILPFGFIRDGQRAADELSNVVQNYCFTFLSKHAGVLSVIDTRTTNARLIKAGITRENIEGYTMDDICNILGAEFIVDGTVVLNKASQTSLASNSYSDKSKSNRNEQKSSGYSSTSATNQQNYETTINLSIYNDKGNSMFSQSRKSFFQTQDAYQNALDYVLKRSPIYSK